MMRANNLKLEGHEIEPDSPAELGKLLSVPDQKDSLGVIEYADFNGDKIKTDKITWLNQDNSSPDSALQYKTASLSKSPLFCNLTSNRRANNFSVQK